MCRHPSCTDNTSRPEFYLNLNSPERKIANREEVLMNTRKDLETKNSVVPVFSAAQFS